MGQYHRIYNKTKKESFRIGGAKLWEQTHEATAAALLLLLSNSNGRGGGDFNVYPQDYDKLTSQEIADKDIVNKVSGRWAGDQIVVQGDYADKKDSGFIENSELDSFTDISMMVVDALLIVDDGNNSETVQIIESEFGASFGSLRGNTSVHKIKSIDRNKQSVEKYHATVGRKPRSKTKTTKLSVLRGAK